MKRELNRFHKMHIDNWGVRYLYLDPISSIDSQVVYQSYVDSHMRIGAGRPPLKRRAFITALRYQLAEPISKGWVKFTYYNGAQIKGLAISTLPVDIAACKKSS